MQTTFRLFFVFIFFLAATPTLFAQATPKDSLPRFIFEGYGSMQYSKYNWQIFPDKRSEIDLERFTMGGGYRFDKQWSMQGEIEIEHGGTGATVEFDRFEEFGEFEYEIEKGGEILLEQLHIDFTPSANSIIMAGRVKVPFGLYNFMDEPKEYSTTSLPEMESAILPTAWTEMGIATQHKLGKLTLRTALISGLDGSAFNSANFVRRGNQRRFETVKAEDLALAIRLDYQIGDNADTKIGASFYGGNTRNNRPKPDLKVDAYLALADVHATLEGKLIRGSLLGVWGVLQNSEAVTIANRSLSNNLNVKRTPVGSQALGVSAEVGLQLFELWRKTPHKDALMAFLRYDYYDTQFRTEGLVFNNPRWERQTATIGLNYSPIPQIIFKAQYSYTDFGTNVADKQKTFSMGLGFQF